MIAPVIWEIILGVLMFSIGALLFGEVLKLALDNGGCR